jgi:tetratricopeptide (TPR) repeat protein
VFWVHASNATRFKQAYQDIAAKVELPGRDDPKADILRLVYNWLCDERNGRWLMILDNADDDRVFSSPVADLEGIAQEIEAPHEATTLTSFLPQTQNGWILVTSQDVVAAVNLVGIQFNVIQVDPMAEEEALELLKTRVSIGESCEGDAKALVQALECIPLAVTHAAAYIAIRKQRITVSTYLELFRESEENRAYLLNIQETRDLRRDDSVPDAVVTTWQISFEQIRKTNPEAADLLSLMTMFDRQGIPELLLYDGRSRLQFEDAVAPLTSFSLVKMQTGVQLFEMHGLVQLATRRWLELNREVHRWQKASLRIMAESFPSGEHETWSACQVLLPHSRKPLSYLSHDTEEMLHRATVANNTALYLFYMGEYVTAENISRSAMEARETICGLVHLDTLISFGVLGLTLEKQGKYEEAEAIHRRALEGQSKVLGLEHLHTLTRLGDLGLILQSQGKYKEAETIHRLELEEREKVLGLVHPATLISVGVLGSVLEKQGKYEEAEAIHQRALEGHKEVLGLEHPHTLTSFSDLGLVLQSQGKYEKAEALHRRALEGREKVLGLEHPNTLTSVYHLAVMFHQQQQYSAASELYQRAWNGYVRTLGAQHSTTIACYTHYTSMVEEMKLE